MADKTFLIFIVSLFLFSFTGCSDSSINVRKEDGKDFSSSRYLTAIGIGKSEAEARRQAVAEMSNIFESKVYNETYSNTKAIIGSSEEEVFEKRVESNIRIVSSVKLKGVKIGKTWVDENTGLYNSLAVLDRLQAREHWTDELENIDEMIQGELATVDAAASKILRLGSLNRIVNLWLQKEAIESRLRVVGFMDENFTEIDMKSVFQTISKIRAEMMIHVDIMGEQEQSVESHISEFLTERGYVLRDEKEFSNVLITGRVAVQPLQLNNPDVHFVRVTLSVDIVDLESGAQIGEISENLRKGHIDQSEAVRKAVQGISAIVSEELIQTFGLKNL
ncbi:MAG: LPP20 family lipoprotein [Desulfobacterales bacterium]|nr:MAG: LPP20 family lipoprotein [Desulfobacterales bacterium]